MPRGKFGEQSLGFLGTCSRLPLLLWFRYIRKVLSARRSELVMVAKDWLLGRLVHEGTKPLMLLRWSREPGENQTLASGDVVPNAKKHVLSVSSCLVELCSFYSLFQPQVFDITK